MLIVWAEIFLPIFFYQNFSLSPASTTNLILTPNKTNPIENIFYMGLVLLNAFIECFSSSVRSAAASGMILYTTPEFFVFWRCIPHFYRQKNLLWCGGRPGYNVMLQITG